MKFSRDLTKPRFPSQLFGSVVLICILCSVVAPKCVVAMATRRQGNPERVIIGDRNPPPHRPLPSFNFAPDRIQIHLPPPRVRVRYAASMGLFDYFRVRFP